MSVVWQPCEGTIAARTMLFIIDVHGPHGAVLSLAPDGVSSGHESSFEIPSDGWHRICWIGEVTTGCGSGFTLQAEHHRRDELSLSLLPMIMAPIEPNPASKAAASALMRGG
jgi:hypothetical protein